MVILPIITLRFSGLLKPLELTAYDFLFYVSPSEPREERIVLVTWDEQDLQITQEVTLSDQTLVSVLEKIEEQQPRLIGLDLYRDLPVLSRLLEKEENKKAYSRLQEIFRTNQKIMGIKQVGNPSINPPPVLQEEGRVFASDIIVDEDNIVRRTYIAKKPTKKETIFYLGTHLGAEYLIKEGFSYTGDNRGSLILYKGKRKIVLENLKTFDGAYINNRTHLDFLINWRRGNNLFETISVRELINDEIPPHIFSDKIVLIGNIASSTADRHNLPITRWDDEQSWTYGINIQAQVASSIISAALDGRPLIKVNPWGSEYFLSIISINYVFFLIFKYSDLPIKKIYFISTLFNLGLTVLIFLFSLLAFQFGWWIPIIPTILGIWLTHLFAINYIQIKKEQNNFLSLELISGELNHKLGNFTRKLSSQVNIIKNLAEIMYPIFSEEYEKFQIINYETKQVFFPETDKPFIETEKAKILDEIFSEIEEIEQQKYIIEKFQQRTTEFISIISSRKKTQREKTNLNQFISQIIAKKKIENQSKYAYKIWIEEVYDSNLNILSLDRLSLEIILDNLINNACDAVAPQLNTNSNYRPTIKIETNKKGNNYSIIVVDNGIGMSKQRQLTIFAPGISYKINKGQGIGLYLTKELIKLENGYIKVESQPNQGSKFSIFFPFKL